jgi:hypothetical protein
MKSRMKLHKALPKYLHIAFEVTTTLRLRQEYRRKFR